MSESTLTGSPVLALTCIVVGAIVGGVIAWLALRSAFAARLAAAQTESALLSERLLDLQERQEEDDATALALAPLTSALARVERQVGILERDRVEQFGEVGERLVEVSASTRALREQTASLAGSLNASSVRGLWGETQLRRVLEHAGMLARCDFDEQVRGVSRHDREVRPDVVVRLPGEKVLVIDAKAPMSGFLAAQRADLDPARREDHLRSHAGALRRHVDALAGKDYWSAFATSPQLVVCFVPSEAVLAAAVEHDPELFESAMRQRVALASPATLLALLRTVAYAWQQHALTDNARELLVLGRELHERLATLGTHVTRMGSSLRRSVEAYNAMVGTLESRVLVTSRRMHDLDLAAEPVPAPAPLEVSPRPLTAVELLTTPEPARHDAADNRADYTLDDGAARRDAAHLEATASPPLRRTDRATEAG